MPDILYRSLLDNTDVLRKLTQIEQRFVQVGSRATITVNVAGLPAARNALNNLGGTRTLNYRVNTIGNIGGLTGQLAAAEARMRSLTFAAGQNLGVTRALGGVFAFIPGPLGLYASAASVAAGALTGLNAAQKLNTIGAFALVGGLAAIGAATALLASRGIEQLKAYQSAVNVLNVAGGGSAGLDAQLRALQEQGGRPAQQFNRAELAQGIAELTKQGLSEAEAFKLVGTSYKLAGAEGEKLNVSSTLLLANLRQFGQTTESASKFGDILAKGSLLAASGAKELQEGLSVVGPVADKAGLSIEETTANLIALDNTGLKASTVGANAFRAVLLALLSPSGKAKDEIKKLGVELKNSDGSARSVRDVLIDLRKAALQSGQGYDSATKSALSQADSVSAIASIFRSRGVVGFLNMTGAVDKYNDALKGSTGTLDKYADELTKGPAAAQERLKKSLDDLALAFAQTFGSKLTAGLDGVTGFFRELDALTQNKDVIQSYFTAVITGIGGITAALILNSEAAKGLLAVNSWSGFITLLQGTVTGGLYAKAAAGLRALALATALNTFANGGNRILGFITALNGIPVAAGLALAGVALLAAGVAAYSLKILGDIKKIQDANETSDAGSNDADLKRIAGYIKAGDDLSKAKAKVLLAVRELQAANQGSVVGSDIAGNAIYKVDPAEVARAQANLTEQGKRLDDVRRAAEAGSVADVMLQGHTKALTTEVKAASVQFGVLSDKLSDLSRKFGDSKLTTFETNLRQSREELKRFSTEVENAVKKGDVSPAEGKNLLGRASRLQTQNIQGLTQRQLDEDTKTQAQHEQEIATARLAILKDARLKRQGEYAAEVTALNEKYAPQIKEALRNATAQGITPAQKRSLQDDAGKLQGQQNEALKAAAAKLTSDLNDLDEERTKKVRDGATQRLQALASEMGQNASSLEAGYKQATELAGDDVKARLAVENSLAPELERVRVRARLAKLKGDQTGLQNDYDDAVRAAKDQGAARVSLENAARETYLSKGRTLQQAYETDVQGYAEARLQAVQVAGAAVTKKQLDLDLQGVKEFTGAQLAAYSALYEAKRKAALAEGDPAKAKEFADALKTISDTKFSNLADFKKQASEAVASLGELRSKLADLNPNKDPLQQARSSAANPFNSLLDTARKAQTAGQNSFSALTPEQQAQQLARFKQQQGELSRFILDANRQRGVALLTADQDFDSKRLQRAQESALKLGKTDYDRSKDSAPYLAALAQDEAYWQARLSIAKKGSQEEADAQQHLSDDASARQQVLATDRQIGETRRTLARDEAQSQLELARTEVDRAQARQTIQQLDTARLAALPAEIQAARARGESEEQIATLIREELALRSNLQKYGEEDLARADEQLARQRTLLESQLELATSDAQRLAIRAGLLSTDQAALSTAQARLDKAVAEGATLEKIAALEDQRDAAAKNVKADRQADLDVVNQLVDSQLKLLGAQDQYAVAIARSNAEVLSAKQSGLATSQAELAQIGQRVAQAQQEGKTQSEINGLTAEYAQKQAGIYEQQKGIRTYLTGLDRQSLDLLEAQARSQAEISGASGDTTKAKLLDLDTTRKELAFADRQLANADQNLLTEQEVNDLKKARLGLLGQEAQQQRDLVQLGLTRKGDELALYQARAALRIAQEGRGGEQSALDIAQRKLDLTRAQVAAAITLDDLTKAQTAESQAQLGVLEAQQNIVKARLETEQTVLSLLKAQGETQLERSGGGNVARAGLTLQNTQRDLTLARERVALAKTDAERLTARVGQEQAVLAVLQAQSGVTQARLGVEQQSLELGKVRASTQLELSGLTDNMVAKADQAVKFAEADLALARERVALARTEDDLRTTQQGELSAQTALSQAQRAAAQARVQAAQQALDIQEAQVRGAAQLVGLADDAVATAQIDLDVTRQKLSLTEQQLGSADKTRLTQEQITALLREQTGLQSQAAEQERKLAEAQRARVTLLENLGTAQRKLGNEALGGSPEARGTRDALLGIAEARSKLTQAEREYAVAQADVNRVQSSTNIEKYRTATEGLTSAISGQRSALGTLASQYAALLGSMDGVRDAGDKLKSVLYGEQEQPFDSKRETDRFSAIQARRDAALKAAQVAVQTGDPAQIAQTTQELAKQEERYRKQAELLGKNGVDVTLRNENAVSKLADQVDRLGIQYDREADLVKQKADAALAESQAAVVFGAGATTFEKGVDSFGAKVAELSASLEKPIKLDLPPLKLAAPQIPAMTADQALLAAIEKLNTEDRRTRAQAGPPDADRARAAALERGIAADNALNAKYFGPGGIVEQERLGKSTASPQPSGAPQGTEMQRLVAAAESIKSILSKFPEIKFEDLVKQFDRVDLERLPSITRLNPLRASLFYNEQSQTIGDNIVNALRPNADTVQQAVNESLSKIRNITPLTNPGSTQAGGRTVNNNQTFTFTVNAAPGQSAEDVGRVVEGKIRELNRNAEIFGGC